MVFSSLTFLFVFLPLVLGFYYITPNKFKNDTLLIFSLIFYAWGEPIYIVLMIFSSIVDYYHGKYIEENRDNKKLCKGLVTSSIIINLSLLGFFKYSDFFIETINQLMNTNIALLELALPIGISFYTFQTMSYTIDIYKGEAKAQKSPMALATYVTLFPQLIAGPIVRYRTVAEQLTSRKTTYDQFADGIHRFTQGLGKKVLLANNMGLLWTTIQNAPVENMSVVASWLGLFAFGMQIYFDFSGYSDMAIGLGKMFGFEFLENFNYPYISKSISEFWRRWHISLGTWFKDYVYIPLGGNKKGIWKYYRNIAIVWFLTGLWHGASWNFVLWGLYFCLLICIEKWWLHDWLKNKSAIWSHVYVIFAITFSWLLFVFEDFSKLKAYFAMMFGQNHLAFFNSQTMYWLSTNVVLMTICVIFATPLGRRGYENIKTKLSHHAMVKHWVVNVLMMGIMITSVAYLVNDAFNPFLYFRF